MEAATVVSAAALTTALIGTVSVPLLQAHFTRKREDEQRLEGRQHAAYLDAITYAQLIDARLSALTEDPLFRGGPAIPQSPEQLLIRAKLVLVAPAPVIRAFDELAQAWADLRWNVNEDGFVEMQGGVAVFAADKSSEDVRRVATALRQFISSVRSGDLGNFD